MTWRESIVVAVVVALLVSLVACGIAEEYRDEQRLIHPSHSVQQGPDRGGRNGRMNGPGRPASFEGDV